MLSQTCPNLFMSLTPEACFHAELGSHMTLDSLCSGQGGKELRDGAHIVGGSQEVPPKPGGKVCSLTRCHNVCKQEGAHSIWVTDLPFEGALDTGLLVFKPPTLDFHVLPFVFKPPMLGSLRRGSLVQGPALTSRSRCDPAGRSPPSLSSWLHLRTNPLCSPWLAAWQ